MRQSRSCPVCASDRTFIFLDRSSVPVNQNLVTKNQMDAVSIVRGDLTLNCCEQCGFVFNSAFDASKVRYDTTYDNSQAYSPFFAEYLDTLVRYLIDGRKVRNCCIVEIGCGKGLFLKKLVEDKYAHNTGYGFDPTYVGPELTLDGRLRFERRFYGDDDTLIPADVVVCRHVIEHVPEPLPLLRSIRRALSTRTEAHIFFETPCLEWILRNQVVWDFFYEHCSLFTANSLATAFEMTGFTVKKVEHVFGDQYLWLEAVAAHGTYVTRQPGDIPQLARQFAAIENTLIDSWRDRIQHLAAKEKIAIWGAGAKGMTLANLIDPERKLIACIVDLNPQKQGNYLPGTGHPIVDYHALADLGVTAAILMNPNYRDENLVLLRQANLDVRLEV